MDCPAIAGDTVCVPGELPLWFSQWCPQHTPQSHRIRPCAFSWKPECRSQRHGRGWHGRGTWLRSIVGQVWEENFAAFARAALGHGDPAVRICIQHGHDGGGSAAVRSRRRCLQCTGSVTLGGAEPRQDQGGDLASNEIGIRGTHTVGCVSGAVSTCIQIEF